MIELYKIVDALTLRIDALVKELLPAGIREGHEYRVGSVHGEKGSSMSISLSGAKAGTWCDFGGPANHRGDALDLIAWCLFHGDKKEAVKWACSWLGFSDTSRPASSPSREARRKWEAEAEKRKKRSQAQALIDAEMRCQNARAIFFAAQPAIAGAPVETYLRGRGIDLRQLSRAPRALRYHPALYNKEKDQRLPAMVAAICNKDGDMVAVHRTWLHVHPDGRVTKADLNKPKMVLGDYRGASIRLWRGASKKPLKDAEEKEMLVVSEGIEDGLSVALACPDLRVLAAISLSNLGLLHLPPAIKRILIAGQNDTEPQAITALEKAVELLLKRGLAVSIARSKVGKDLNDLLQGKD